MCCSWNLQDAGICKEMRQRQARRRQRRRRRRRQRVSCWRRATAFDSLLLGLALALPPRTLLHLWRLSMAVRGRLLLRNRLSGLQRLLGHRDCVKSAPRVSTSKNM
jgi:hypothetical protein